MPSRLEDWTLAVIQSLAKLGVSEDSRFDFKSGGILRPGQGIESLSKSATSFANGGGGFIVIGVEEEKGRWNVVGVDPDQEIAKHVNDKIKAEPSLNYPPPRSITLADGRTCYVVFIPKSEKGPHAAVSKEGVRFYHRTHSGAGHMGLEMLRDRFLRTEERQTRLRLLLNELHRLEEQAWRMNRFNIGGQDIVLEPFETSTLRRIMDDLYPLLAGNLPLMAELASVLGATARFNVLCQRAILALAATTLNQAQTLAHWKAKAYDAAQNLANHLKVPQEQLRLAFPELSIPG